MRVFRCNGQSYVGETDLDIVEMMAQSLESMSAIDWKANCKRRAEVLGFELEFKDAHSFLNAMERAGLGQRVPFLE